MATLHLRICAAMQSWGTDSHFDYRCTDSAPSKSGIIGLGCAALGWPRNADISDLRALRMAVRIDRPGMIMCDFQTAGIDGIYKVDGTVNRENVIVSDRFYLADAKFLVGLEGDPRLLTELQAAIRQPQRPLFFGRRKYTPAERVYLEDGLQDTDLVSALSAYPSLDSLGPQPETLQLLIADDNGPIVRNDQPISFQPRRYIRRRILSLFVPNPAYLEEV